MRLALSLTLLLLAFPTRLPAQPLIAPTDPKTPAEERKALVVPFGFEVQLVASEPDIQKPIQMAFDAKGRLWVTTSHHYPFPAEKGKGTDKLFVLSDFGADGKARKVQVFADTLNIPIGILPLPDCNSCIVSSVGEIRKLTDTDGDGKADKTETLFTGFGTRDTHGMYNSFTLMPDGWVYACHGFSNESTVKGKDGHEVKMQSGNTFRFRPDGSRIEVYTRGQVNPFGIAIDPWFNLYTADCHSKPITQLIPGAYYQSFGKPNDGLGYAPHVTRHDHGSTALCGLTWYDADQFPKEYKGRLFLGNVVTNRVNADVIEWHGSTPVAREQPDFVTSKDPWFRPTDIKLGPDGALYVTDFYNKIIGHYEVDLKHPLRDKDRGRVWRIVWKGIKDPAPPPKMPFTDLTKEAIGKVDDLIGHANLTVRLLATNEAIRRAEGAPPRAGAELYTAHRQWVDAARGWMSGVKSPDATGPTGSQLAAVHLYRIARAREEWAREHPGTARKQISPVAENPVTAPGVARAHIEALAAHPHRLNTMPLVAFIKAIPADDTHLKFAARIALRNTLRDAAEAWNLAPPPGSPDAAIVADVALGIPDAQSAAFLAKYVAAQANPPRLPELVEHIARYGDDAARDAIVKAARATTDWRKQHAVVIALRKGVAARGQQLRPTENALAAAVVTTGLADKDAGIVVPSCELASSLKMAGQRAALTALATDRSRPELVRIAALEAVVSIDPAASVAVILPIVNDLGRPARFRERAALVLSAVNTPEAVAAVRGMLKTVPYRVSVALATGLASSRPGAEALLAAVKAGEGSPRLLQEKPVIERLRASGLPGWDNQVAELTKGLPPADQRLAAFIRDRAIAFAASRRDKELGAKLFTKHCGACHQIGGQGGKVGPNLDGVGNRGLDRILEDTLDPNRNVDQAFRAKVLNLTDGTSKSGLLLRTEGEVLVLADDQGKEFRVSKADIDKIRDTTLSPMPTNFGTLIPESDFFHLIDYLLEQKVKDPPKK